MHELLAWVFQAFLLFVLSTTVLDGVHWAAHRCARHRKHWLRLLGRTHMVHHLFLNEGLRIDKTWERANLAGHVLWEYAVQLLATAAGLLVFPLPSVLLAAAWFTAFRLTLIALRGQDLNHRERARYAAPLHGFWVGPAYHALHHRFPDRFFGSQTTLFDRVFGFGFQVRGRTVAITGSGGAFGAPLKSLLEAAGATVLPLKYGHDWCYGHYEGTHGALNRAELLILAHGAGGAEAQRANCESFVGLIEVFLSLKAGSRFPPEVWAVGSESETHPAWGNPDFEVYLRSKRAFARYARRYYWDDRLLYRHIVPSGYTSPLGKGLMSGATAARVAWFLIRRGFRYVPVSYTGVAFINYFKFLFRWRMEEVRT